MYLIMHISGHVSLKLNLFTPKRGSPLTSKIVWRYTLTGVKGLKVETYLVNIDGVHGEFPKTRVNVLKMNN